jgi:uncharacterized protein (TIGR00725 family)
LYFLSLERASSLGTLRAVTFADQQAFQPKQAWPPIIAVAGAAQPSDSEAAAAFETGQLLARRGAIVTCGGLGGVMDEVARGVAQAGGTSVGLLPGRDYSDASSWLTIPITTGLGEARNVVLALACRGMIAIGGGFGTLSEMAFALRLRKPLAVLHSWTFSHPSMPPTELLYNAQSPSDAVDWILNQVHVVSLAQ